MGFMDKAKEAAEDLKASFASNEVRDSEQAYRDLGMIAYLTTTGRPIDESDRQRLLNTLWAIEQQGKLPAFRLVTAAPPPPPPQPQAAPPPPPQPQAAPPPPPPAPSPGQPPLRRPHPPHPRHPPHGSPRAARTTRGPRAAHPAASHTPLGAPAPQSPPRSQRPAEVACNAVFGALTKRWKPW